MSLRKLPLLATLALVGLWAIAFTATHWPIPHPKEEALFPHADKIAHLTIYAALAMVAMFAARAWNFSWSPRLAVHVTLALVAVGIFDELTQMLVVGRTPDPTDLLADALGAMAGVGIYSLARNFFAPASMSAGDPQ